MKKVEGLLLFLTLLSLPTQLGRHFWPNFSYIYSLKIDYLSPTIFFWDILVAGLTLVWLLGKPRVNKIALNLFLLFLFTQTLSLFGAASIGAGLVRLEQYVVAGFLGIYLASSEKIKLVFVPLLLGTVGESLIAILQFISGSTLGLWVLGERTFNISTPGIAKFDFYGRQFLRPYATFPHPNVLAGYLLVVSALVIRKPIVLVLSSLTILLTMSRAAILGGIISLAFFLRKKSIMIIIFISFITVILSPLLFVRFASIFNFDNLTLLRREELLGNAWDLFLKNPFFGAGLNNFIPALANNLVSGPNRFLQPVHNIFLLALSETGLIGFIGLVILIFYPMAKSRNYVPWLIIIFLGLFDHYFLTLPQGYRLLFLVWGLSLSPRLNRGPMLK